MIIGGLLYKRSNKLDARLLQFTFSIMAFKGFLHIIYTAISYIHLQKIINSHANVTGPLPSIWAYIWPLLITLPIAYVAYQFTKWLIADQKVIITEKNNEGEMDESAIVASKGKRFWHYIFDLILMLLFLLPVLGKVAGLFTDRVSFSQQSTLLQSSQFLLSFVIIFGLFFYYLFFEGVFQATPIKFLTGTRVVHVETLEKPSFGQVFRRTLSRHIPFEAFSFFGNTGWHDSISNTSVVVEDTQGRSRKYHGWWGFIFLLTFIGSVAYTLLEPKLQRRYNRKFQLKVGDKIQRSMLTNLNVGDIVIGYAEKEDYNKAKRYFRVSSVMGEDIIADVFQAPYKKTFKESTIIKTITNSNAIDKIAFTKDELQEAMLGKKEKTLDPGKGKTYRVSQIYDLDHPTFKGAGSTSNYNDKQSIRTIKFTYEPPYTQGPNGLEGDDINLSGLTFPIEILSIRTIKGSVKWVDRFPISNSFNQSRQEGRLHIQAQNMPETKPTKAEMVLKYNNREHIYILEWQAGNSFFYRQVEK